MLLLHFHHDDDNLAMPEYLVLLSNTEPEKSDVYHETYGAPGYQLDAYDLSLEQEWPVTLPLDRGLKAMGI